MVHRRFLTISSLPPTGAFVEPQAGGSQEDMFIGMPDYGIQSFGPVTPAHYETNTNLNTGTQYPPQMQTSRVFIPSTSTSGDESRPSVSIEVARLSSQEIASPISPRSLRSRNDRQRERERECDKKLADAIERLRRALPPHILAQMRVPPPSYRGRLSRAQICNIAACILEERFA